MKRWKLKRVLPVYADIRRIEQVVKNLLTNAIKYSPGQKEIFINATIKDHMILISVQDTGIGIPAGEIENIFSSYYRVPVQASTFTGAGIGTLYYPGDSQITRGRIVG